MKSWLPMHGLGRGPSPTRFLQTHSTTPGAVRPAVAEVADEHEPAALGVPAHGVVAEAVEQRVEGGDLAVDIADDIDRAVEQGLDEGVNHSGGDS